MDLFFPKKLSPRSSSSAPENVGDTLGRLTLERVCSGALVARKTQLPVLTSGGAVFGGTAEAVVTTRSRNARTNSRETAALPLPLGIARVLLVVPFLACRGP